MAEEGAVTTSQKAATLTLIWTLLPLHGAVPPEDGLRRLWQQLALAAICAFLGCCRSLDIGASSQPRKQRTRLKSKAEHTRTVECRTLVAALHP